MPQLNRHLVDLGRQDEIILGQSVDGMGPKGDGHIAVTFQMEVGVVSFLLGQARRPC